METISIAKDFTRVPWARYKKDGNKSGEEFYDDILRKKLETWTKENRKDRLQIDLDNTLGYPSSFLSEVFGRMQKEFWKEVWEKVLIKSEDNPALEPLIKEMANEYKGEGHTTN